MEYPLLDSISSHVAIKLKKLTMIETTYLDHAGTTVYPRSLLQAFEKDMTSHIFGNPHSHSPSSMLSTDRMESTRCEALRFFKADPERFDLIFVANATAAIKMVMDCMLDYSREDGGFWYGYHGDAHTSLVGIREVADRGSRCFESDQDVENWLSGQNLNSSKDRDGVGLFAFPGQSNMNGRRLPLVWPGRIRSSAGSGRRTTYSLLDAAALVSTAPLDLSDHQNAPDFTALSFYKIFGYPDLGALIVRKDVSDVMSSRRFFGGGTVDMIINGQVQGADKAGWFARKATSMHEMLEEGTPAFHSIAALGIALRVHKQLYGSMANVSSHAGSLAKALYEAMSRLSHANGLSVCQIYKSQHSQYGDSKTQGPTIAFNVRSSNGKWIGKSDLEALAILNNIQFRTGGLCNPGGIACSLDISPDQMLENFQEGLRCGNELDELNGKPTGVVRVSLGAMSSAKDVSTFLNFMQIFVDHRTKILPDSSVASQEFSEKPARQDKFESFKGNSQTQVLVTSVGNTKCPVAACGKVFGSRDDLIDHFPLHRIGSRQHFWS